MTDETPTANRDVINWAGSLIGLIMVSLLGFALWALVYHAIPSANANAFTLLLGILSANVGMVIGFYYGSSSGSKKQQEIIGKLADTAQTAGKALASTPDTMTMNPGDTATANTSISGTTTIHKDKP